MRYAFAAAIGAAFSLVACAPSSNPLHRCLSRVVVTEPGAFILTVAAAPLSAAFCTLKHGIDPENPAQLNDGEICSRAIDRGEWDPLEKWQPYVAEANRRRLTIEHCMQAVPARTLCLQALVAPHSSAPQQWEPARRFQPYVREAQRRGYTPEACAKAG
jgi:hypothetical protein